MKHRKRQLDWPAVAGRVGALVPAAGFPPAVRAWLDRARARDTWMVAFSGGADSLALLLVLWALWPERRDRLVALHFNHRLRGKESLAEEKFCVGVGASLGISVRVGRWVGARPGASEAVSRAARHTFFGREMKKKGCRCLWLAHQQGDIAESILMRLARGSGAAGLSAPRFQEGSHVGRAEKRRSHLVRGFLQRE
jgi:tRNA(Ile)-lysidine synthase